MATAKARDEKKRKVESAIENYKDSGEEAERDSRRSGPQVPDGNHNERKNNTRPIVMRAPAGRGAQYSSFMTFLSDEPVEESHIYSRAFRDSFALWSAIFYSKSAAPVPAFWRNAEDVDPPARLAVPTMGSGGPMRPREHAYVVNTKKGVALAFGLDCAVSLQSASRWLRGKFGKAVRDTELRSYCNNLNPLGDLDLLYLGNCVDTRGLLEDTDAGGEDETPPLSLVSFVGRIDDEQLPVSSESVTISRSSTAVARCSLQQPASLVGLLTERATHEPFQPSVLWAFAPENPPALEVVRELHESRRRELIRETLEADLSSTDATALTLPQVVRVAAELASSGALPSIRNESLTSDRLALIKRCVGLINSAKQDVLTGRTAPESSGNDESTPPRNYSKTTKEAAKKPSPSWQDLCKSKFAADVKTVKSVRKVLNTVSGSYSCDQCGQGCDSDYFLDVGEGVWRPIVMYKDVDARPSSKAKRRVIFCQSKCEEEWRLGMDCPKCGNSDWVHSATETVADVAALMRIQCDLVDILRYAKARREELSKGADASPIAEEIEIKRERVKAAATRRLPLRVCATCSVEMITRAKASDTRPPLSHLSATNFAK